jgi:hypothetical protein
MGAARSSAKLFFPPKPRQSFRHGVAGVKRARTYTKGITRVTARSRAGYDPEICALVFLLVGENLRRNFRRTKVLFLMKTRREKCGS